MRKYLKNQTPVPSATTHKNSLLSKQAKTSVTNFGGGFATPASSNNLDASSINIKQATRFSNGINRANTSLQPQRANRSLV
jgi:hypothetical protein